MYTSERSLYTIPYLCMHTCHTCSNYMYIHIYYVNSKVFVMINLHQLSQNEQ